MFLGLVSVVDFVYGFRYIFVMVSLTPFLVSVAGFLVDSAAAGGSKILERIERFLVFVFLGLVSVVDFVLWFPLRFFMVSVTFFMVSVAGFLVASAAAGGSNILECIERFLVFFVLRTGFRRYFFVWVPSWQETVVLWFPSFVFFNGFSRGKELCLWFPSFFLLLVSGCYRTAAFSPMETVKTTSGRFRDKLSIHIYIYIYTYVHVCVCIYIYIYIYYEEIAGSTCCCFERRHGVNKCPHTPRGAHLLLFATLCDASTNNNTAFHKAEVFLASAMHVSVTH